MLDPARSSPLAASARSAFAARRALADVGAGALLAAGRQRTLGLRGLQALAAVNQRKALRLRHVNLDERRRRVELHGGPPRVLWFVDGQGTQFLVAGWNLGRLTCVGMRRGH